MPSKNSNRETVNRLIGMYEETKGREVAFQEAARWGLLDHVVRLQQAGVDVNCRTAEGFTALMLASFAAKPEVVQHLLQSGADPTLRAANGQTALVSAVGGLMPESLVLKVVRLLLAAGAAPSVANDTGATPLDLAQTRYSERLCDLLRSPTDRG